MSKKQPAAAAASLQKEQQFVLALTEKETTELNELLGEIPAKFANPLFQFFNKVAQTRHKESQGGDQPTTSELVE